MSVVSAVIAKYATVPFPGTRPPLYFDLAPTRTATGAALELPWLVLKDRGMRIEYELEYRPYEVTTVEFEIYAVQLSDADTYATAVKYGGSPSTQAGFDFGTLTLSPQTFKSMRRVNEQRDLQTVQSEQVLLVHRVMLTYEVESAYEF